MIEEQRTFPPGLECYLTLLFGHLTKCVTSAKAESRAQSKKPFLLVTSEREGICFKIKNNYT